MTAEVALQSEFNGIINAIKGTLHSLCSALPKSLKTLRHILPLPLSRPLTMSGKPGRFAYVVDTDEIIHVIPDGLHVHPLILGLAQEVLYVGDLTIETAGVVGEITNLSGTFQFKSQRSLCCVVEHLHQLGFAVKRVMWFAQRSPVYDNCSVSTPEAIHEKSHSYPGR